MSIFKCIATVLFLAIHIFITLTVRIPAQDLPLSNAYQGKLAQKQLLNNPPLDQVGTQWAPFVEWTLSNPTYSGNPFDLVATVTFVHNPGAETQTTEMFYESGSTWKFRFTGTRAGIWTFTTSSTDSDLDNLSGTVEISPNPDPDIDGFLTAQGTKYGRQTGQSGALAGEIPKVYMNLAVTEINGSPFPMSLMSQPTVRSDYIQEAIDNGFTTIFLHVNNQWFKWDAISYLDHNSEDPDPASFQVIETLITEAHQAGLHTVIWAWGDEQRKWTPIGVGGINGIPDQRMQRYIAARLGPLPGWSMGYGFDLTEWTTENDLQVWAQYLHDHFGWQHLLWGRGRSNSELDVASNDIRPAGVQQDEFYQVAVAALDTSNGRPVLFERRFAYLRNGIWTMDNTRRAMWQFAMAGGAAGWWGFFDTSPAPYPNPEQLQTHEFFWQDRFLLNFQRDALISDGFALRELANTHYIFYKEDANAIQLDLSAMAGTQAAIAVDAKLAYEEINLGNLSPNSQTWIAPYPSDWAIAVGDFGGTTVIDTIPPAISNVVSSNITSFGATITWVTNELANSRVEYGFDTNYRNTTSLDSLHVLNHSQTLSGLSPSTTYHYRVLSEDAAGNLAAGFDLTFTTFDTITAANFKIAFIGDQGSGANAQAVLNLIKNEGAQAVVHSGDFDYADDPKAWDDQINATLGEYFPYFACIGNHDLDLYYGPGGYQEFMAARMNRLGLTWDGDLGVQSSHNYRGIFFVMTAAGIAGSGHDLYIRDQLAQDNSTWSISSWHRNMQLMQVGGALDATGWEVYEQSRAGGAIIATAHDHTYSRTHLLSSMQNQTIASTSNTLILSKDLAGTPVDEGKSFVFVSGIAGHIITQQQLSGAWWASIYTATQGANFGALFGEFNYNGSPNLARFYFKDIDGAVPDSFYVVSGVENIFALDVRTTGSGTVDLSPAGPYYRDGTVVTLVATPNTGWQFAGWSGDLTGSANPATLVMDGNKSVAATFSQPGNLQAGDVIIAGFQSSNKPSGQSPGEFVELFNTTGSTISLESMDLISRVDGVDDSSVAIDWQLSAEAADLSRLSIAPYGFFLIAEAGVNAPSNVHDLAVDMDLTTSEGGSNERAISLQLVIDGVHMDYVLYGRHDGTDLPSDIPAGDIAFDGVSYPRDEINRNTRGRRSFHEGLVRRLSADALHAGHAVAGFYTDENALGDGYAAGIWHSPHDETFGNYQARNSLSPGVPPSNGAAADQLAGSELIGSANPTTKSGKTEDLPVILPTKFALFQNYPNPFNTGTKIKFSLPEGTNIKIQIVNVSGKTVSVLADGYFPAGDHAITFRPENLASGIYLCIMDTDAFGDMRRMLYLK